MKTRVCVSTWQNAHRVGTSFKRHCCSVTKSCPTLCIPRTAVCQTSLSFIISRSLLKLKSIESVMPSNHFILCHPLLLPSAFSSIRVFSNESAQVVKVLEFQHVLPVNIQG
ncbi:unnamed protein product [Rangifer tarandus platyrhynchus]|uniref:Uncharacterized protein n=1 Tax=Rangifer tarandus platyrhynchus TaxID=3082113 RepID=A0AC59YJE3_RANTA